MHRGQRIAGLEFMMSTMDSPKKERKVKYSMIEIEKEIIDDQISSEQNGSQK